MCGLCDDVNQINVLSVICMINIRQFLRQLPRRNCSMVAMVGLRGLVSTCFNVRSG